VALNNLLKPKSNSNPGIVIEAQNRKNKTHPISVAIQPVGAVRVALGSAASAVNRANCVAVNRGSVIAHEMTNDGGTALRDKVIAEMNGSFSKREFRQPGVDIRNDGMDAPDNPYSGFGEGWAG